MKLAGFLKNSFVDFPKTISCVVFTLGCNMDCWYCHNRHLIDHHESVSESQVFNFLASRKGLIEGVVISGGEPTLHSGLVPFIKKIKDMGFKTKLDTNGTNCAVINELIDKNLVDYIAMDIKAPLKKYKSITGTDDDMLNIEASIKLLLKGKVDYEFRTTFSPDLSVDDIEEIAKTISGAKLYALQKYRLTNNKVVMNERVNDDQIKASEKAKKYVVSVVNRGL